MAKQHASSIDIIIAGGGLNGLIAGMIAAKVGYRALMVEPQSLDAMQNPLADGRASTIAATSFTLLKNLGLAEDLTPHAQPINDIRVTESDPLLGTSPFFLHFSAEDAQTDKQPFGYVIENSLLRKVFYQHASKCKNLKILHDRSVAKIDLTPEDDAVDKTGTINQQSATVTLDNGDCYMAKLVIACDGRNSPLRTQANIQAVTWDYRQKAIITALFHERNHGGVAVEQFHPKGAFAILPMTEQRSALVWIDKDNTADKLMRLDDAQFLLMVKEKMGDWLGDLAMAAPRQCYPLSFSHAKQYYQHRFILLGDSAHAIHPLAGQGLNLGLRDSAVLWDILQKAQRLGLDIGREETLKDFATWRKQDNHAVAAMTDLLNRIFANNIPPLKLIRQLGMKAIHHTPPLKNYFAKRAMGIRKNMPSMMQVK